MRNIGARVGRLGIQPNCVHRRGLAVLTLVLLAAVGGAQEVAQEKDAASVEKEEKAKEETFLAAKGITLTPETKRDIVDRVLNNADLKGKGPNLKAIRVSLGEAPLATGEKQTVATVVLFDHKKGVARRVSMDTATDKLLQDVELPGRPQSSGDEVKEATDIIRKDPALALLLKQGGVLDGGFIINDPAGSRHRLLQLKLLSTDRRRLLKALTVDLTSGTIAPEPKAPVGKKGVK